MIQSLEKYISKLNATKVDFTDSNMLKTCVKGIFVSHRRGLRRLRPTQSIIKINNVTDSETASAYINNAIMFCYRNKDGKTIRINGFIRATHGNKGALRATFERNLNPQWIGREVYIKLYKH
ncbi:RL35A [Hepatospora eriocheir]|uniref:RL35A n=1 Tax=Hepatospora eriocheir TaxID=1081669 RepID=A0A1X0QJ21_9MICR|nr:RL35A [Hepatospora eriocheir]